MNQLINDLLNLSRLNRSPLKIETIDLSELVDSYAKQFQELYADRNITFIIQPQVFVACDLGLLRIVIDNLLNNSTKFTQNHSQATIEFGTCLVDSAITYFIKDDGAGFDMSYSDKLFGVFQRLHRVDEFEGNGIGLATIQRIIHRHNGKVWAEGALEKGATFYFTLNAEGRLY